MKTNDYNTRVEVNIYMTKYVGNSISVYPLNIDKYEAVTTLASNNLFKVDGSNPLKIKKRDFSYNSGQRVVIMQNSKSGHSAQY